MRPQAMFPAWLQSLRSLSAGLLLAVALQGMGQTAAPVTAPQQGDPAILVPAAAQAAAVEAAVVPAPVQPLVNFQPGDIKFKVRDLMDLLRDRRHEGWVLASYPDPKTGRPLIGAGFSLDLPERQHVQTDLLNPNNFVEPSSAQLWQAAGLDPALLQQVLQQFDDRLATWRTTRRYRHKIGTLAPQITNDQAEALLRISAIQAIVNARAWCREFDQLTGTQQMAMSQLVYQMGVNLGEFSTFLSLINNESAPASSLANPGVAASTKEAGVDSEHWRDVQQSLMQSQWARLYRVRAVAVIAMLDPHYLDDPSASEARIAAVLRPVRHRRGHGRATLRAASYSRHAGHAIARKSATRPHAKRKA
jgi:hypothetical protein